MLCESRVADRFDRGSHSRNQTDAFQMKMPACNFCVVRNFGKDVWEQIGSAYLGSIVKLGADRRGKGGWKGDESTYVLVGILDAYPNRPMIVQVIGDAQLRSARVRQTYPDVLIFVV